MRYTTLTLLLFFVAGLGFAQSEQVVFDYTVTYKVPSKKRRTVDTVSIGFTKNGQYIFTDSKLIAKDFAADVFGGAGANGPGNSAILYNASTADLHFSYDSDGILM
ncbi:MAG: hypothetical protein AAFP76_17295, partial [Bacteroidota bacterium]